MKIIITANGIEEHLKITPSQLARRVRSGELYRCESGCNEIGMSDDPIIYHVKGRPKTRKGKFNFKDLHA